MASGIEWTDETWNPVVGCEWASDGCTGCYAARDAFGRLSKNPIYEGLAHRRRDDELPRFTGELRFAGAPGLAPEVDASLRERLYKPLHWTKARMVFVNSMSDLFHPDVPDDFIDSVFAVMAATKARFVDHVFQILTKRPKRMAAYLTAADRRERVASAAASSTETFLWPAANYLRYHRDSWPLPNVWPGTSVESQRWADARVPHVVALGLEGWRTFLSVEPLLEHVHLWAPRYRQPGGGLGSAFAWGRGVSWVIVGGESGPRARPMHPEWVRDVRNACAAAEVPFFFKQWGEWMPDPADPIVPLRTTVAVPDGTFRYRLGIAPRDGEVAMVRAGKKNAGAVLDGREHKEWPT